MTSVYVGFVFRKLRMHRLRVWIGMETVADPISAYWMWVGERAGYSIATTIFCNVYPPSTLAKQRAAKTILPKLLFCSFVFSSMCDNYFLHFSAHRFCKKQADSDNELLFCLFGHCFCLFSHCFCNFGFPRKVQNIVAKNSVAKSVISENQYYTFLQFICKKCNPPQTF